MIDEYLGHASELRKHPQDTRFGPIYPAPFGCGVSGGVSARQPSFSVKTLTNRGQSSALLLFDLAVPKQATPDGATPDPAVTGKDAGGFRLPLWAKPAPLGYGPAADAAHFVSAPLLAAGCIAVIGVIGAATASFRWPGPAMLALTLGAISLIGSIQYGFHARALLYPAKDLEDWRGPDDLADRTETLREHQHDHFRQWKIKINRVVTAYNLGITLLAAGIALCLAPPATAKGTDAITRWIAAAEPP
jgi:hypothetical protein